jgi:hypothetical protein
MTAVILVIDELIDDGVIMTLDSNILLARIEVKLKKSDDPFHSPGDEEETFSTGTSSSSGGGGLFSKVFSNAKDQLAKSLAF